MYLNGPGFFSIAVISQIESIGVGSGWLESRRWVEANIQTHRAVHQRVTQTGTTHRVSQVFH